MAACPKCGKEIDHLNQFAQAEMRYKFTLDAKGNPVSVRLGPSEFEGEDDFECPECQELLTCDEKDAARILKGEEIE
jgi:predicted RNA-binding Zn-ribbon protein involved in translation (DUF1610 family)